MHNINPLISTLLIVSSAVLFAEDANVDSQLPEPGTWIKYYSEEYYPGARQQLDPEEITIKFLGEVTHEDEQYVRIEFFVEPVHKRHVSKCLIVIRKDALLTGNLRKRDIRLSVSKLASLPSKDDTSEISDPLAERKFVVAMLLSGGLSHWKEVHIADVEEPVSVDWKRGRATVHREASIARTFDAGRPDRKAQLILTNGLHESPPNGVLFASIIQSESQFDTESKRWSEFASIGFVKLTLMDFGKGARAALKE